MPITVASSALQYNALPMYVPSSYKLRVVFQVNNMDKGGLEKVVYDLATHLNRQHFEVQVLAMRGGGWLAERLEREGIRVFVLKEETRELYRQFLRQEKIDIINAHYSYFGLDIAVEEGVPIIQTLHNTYVWWVDQQIAEHRRMDEATHGYIAISKPVAHYADAILGVRPNKIHLIPNGFNINEWESQNKTDHSQNIRHELRLSEEDFVFINTATFYPHKSQLLIVRALNRLIQDFPRLKVLFLGHPGQQEYYDAIRQYVVEQNLESNVIFCGFRQDVRAFYSIADAFLLPSFWEGWSIALAEAVYSQLPVIVTDVGSARELVEENKLGIVLKNPIDLFDRQAVFDLNAELCPDIPDFLDELVHAMKKLYCERTLWKEKALLGRSIIEQQYSIMTIAARYENLIIAASRKYGRKN